MSGPSRHGSVVCLSECCHEDQPGEWTLLALTSSKGVPSAHIIMTINDLILRESPFRDDIEIVKIITFDVITLIIKKKSNPCRTP